ncbi:GGDEF domain-containing protein [Desulforhopalus vacuolatus]|uniref:GGDEF domain-containing protein n=1 Tax=Desulforhopalus vacuolatus TaxID=40414 RepID=UPI0019638CED|nr:GGDEF domain-containing protein [Desulforhopalus vacuolatus]MBM9519094.1 GGDEF domain-containing protein [Desulforhopalus vacuolatus]
MLNRKSLRYRITLTVALTLTVVTLIFGTALTVYETNRRNAAVLEIDRSLKQLTSQYSEQLGNEIFASQTMAMKATMAEIMKRKSILTITAYNEYGEVLVSTDKNAKKKLSREQIGALWMTSISTKQKENNQSVLDFASPITAYGENVGFWNIHYSLASLERETREIILLFTTLILSIAILTGIVLNSILVRVVLTPVYKLRNVMQHIQGIGSETGDGGGQRLDKMVQAFDEFSEDLSPVKGTENEIILLASSFQEMMFALKHAYANMRTDVLTQLNNRMRLDEVMEYELKRVNRYSGTFSIILMDIDYFKKVNDTYGHLAGDEALKKMADILRKNFREIDTPGRWGGEEFLIILPQLDGIKACMIAERVRAAIETTVFPDIGIITCSFGITEYKAKDTIQKLTKRVDDALYAAKELGRNCCVEEK